MTALLLTLLAAGLLGALVLQARRAARAAAAMGARLDAIDERFDQLERRLEATEQDLAMALSQTGVAEGLLLEKGIADADEVAEMRRRLVTDGAAPGDGDAIH